MQSEEMGRRHENAVPKRHQCVQIDNLVNISFERVQTIHRPWVWAARQACNGHSEAASASRLGSLAPETQQKGLGKGYTIARQRGEGL